MDDKWQPWNSGVVSLTKPLLKDLLSLLVRIKSRGFIFVGQKNVTEELLHCKDPHNFLAKNGSIFMHCTFEIVTPC